MESISTHLVDEKARSASVQLWVDKVQATELAARGCEESRLCCCSRGAPKFCRLDGPAVQVHHCHNCQVLVLKEERMDGIPVGNLGGTAMQLGQQLLDLVH